MNTHNVKPQTPCIDLVDWNALTEAGAICVLCRRIGVNLRVSPEGKLKATGDALMATLPYIADISSRYRGAIIAYLLHLPSSDVTDEQDSVNILANVQALDVTIADYCAVIGCSIDYREKLLSVRRRMPAYLLMQNLCAFRAWLYEVKEGGDHGHK